MPFKKYEPKELSHPYPEIETRQYVNLQLGTPIRSVDV
jgi:hypothetical protein